MGLVVTGFVWPASLPYFVVAGFVVAGFVVVLAGSEMQKGAGTVRPSSLQS